MFVQWTTRKWGTMTSARLGDATLGLMLPTDTSPVVRPRVLPPGCLPVTPTAARSGDPEDVSSSSCEISG